MQEELELKCEEDLARVHKYLLQAFDKNIESGIKRNLPFSMIRAKEMYKTDKEAYDKVYRFYIQCNGDGDVLRFSAPGNAAQAAQRSL